MHFGVCIFFLFFVSSSNDKMYESEIKSIY